MSAELSVSRWKDRLLEKSIPVPEAGCWIWTFSQNAKGYGLTGILGLPNLAHRASYTVFRGPIPEGAVICHKCDTPSCINPDHLFAGSRADNVRDCLRKGRFQGQKKTHCKRGHEFTPENTKDIRLHPGQRECRECSRVRTRAAMRKARAGRKLAALTAAMNGGD